MRAFLILLLSIFVSTYAIAGSIAGKVVDKQTGKPLVGANVYLKGTTIGAATDENGMYYIKVDDGTYTLVANYVGYADQAVRIKVKGDVRHDFALTEYLFSKTIEVVADRAQERVTPVAFTNVDDAEMAKRAENWQPPKPYADRGALAKYARLVSSASEGAVTDKE